MAKMMKTATRIAKGATSGATTGAGKMMRVSKTRVAKGKSAQTAPRITASASKKDLHVK